MQMPQPDANWPRLMTFLQISDLHIGPVDPRTCSARAPRIMPRWKRFAGLLGHHMPALNDLRLFVQRLRRHRRSFEVIVTGDLSSFSTRDQFETARQFLGDRLSPKLVLQEGLDLDANRPGQISWSSLTIPGNHDRWAGLPLPVGGSPVRFHTVVQTNYPEAGPVVTLNKSHRIRFLRIDTDADLKRIGEERTFARGRFNSQLDALSRVIGQRPEAGETRVLLMHHSRNRGEEGELTIVDDSRRALEQFLVEYRVPIVLCGHTHVPRVKRFQATTPAAKKLEVLECCCGTTTQCDGLPMGWDKFPDWELEPNSLIVHEVYLDGDRLVWWPVYFQRDWTRFVPSTATRLRPRAFHLPP